MQIQYLGFEPKASGRAYGYRVIGANCEPREFVFSIPTQSFMEGRIRYQEAASVCYQKLERALEEETPERPVPRHATVSDRELDDYRETHTPTKRHTFGNSHHRANSVHAQHPKRIVN